jgi:hypothetical protein
MARKNLTIQNINNKAIPRFSAFNRNWARQIVNLVQINVLDVIAR